MKCPKCSNRRLSVLDTKPGPEFVRRFRQCKKCGHRFKTMEVIWQDTHAQVVKQLGAGKALLAWSTTD